MKPLLAVTALAATLILAGCTGPTSGPDFVTPPQDAEGRYVIELTGTNLFIPKYAEVPAGATVVWKNIAGAHNVEADDGSFSSGAVRGGAWEYEHTFETAGEWPYHCHPHESVGMEGTLRVVASEALPTDEPVEEPQGESPDAEADAE
jgi:plastocyanin